MKNTCEHCHVKRILPYLELRPCRLMICNHPPVIAGDPGTVVKICFDCVNFCRVRSNMVSHTHTTTTSTVHRVTIPVAALSTVLTGVIPFCWISRAFLPFPLIFVPVNISFSSNFAMHLFSVVPFPLPTCMCYWGKPPLNESPPQTRLWVIGASWSEPHLMKVPLKPAYGVLGQAGVSHT